MQDNAKKWTDKQLQAIFADNENILVSAAAGSGKTSVMIERVMRLIEDGGTLSRMLIVTFTRAAAADMKRRLSESLILNAEKDPRFAKEYHSLSRSHISTLHTFCRDLLREHFEEAGLDPLAKIGDPNLLSALKTRAFDEAMDELYAKEDTDSKSFINAFSEEEILEYLNTLYYYILSRPEPFEWLNRTLENGSTMESLKQSPLYALLKDEALIQLEGALQLADECESIVLSPNGPARYLEAAKMDKDIVLACIDQIEKSSFATYKNLKFTKLSSKKAPPDESEQLRERYKTLRSRLKKCVEEANSLLPQDDEELESYAHIIRKTLPFKRALVDLIKSAHEKFLFYKSQNAVLDFSDLEHLSLEALKHEHVQKSVSESFDYIFVDEYQDISRIQEAIISKIHGDNKLFMVGDVRQSIYRFRLADPGLFLHKYSNFEEAEKAQERLVLLNTNFRSSKNILLAVNEVFANAMRERVTELDYDDKARLNPKENQIMGSPVEVHIVKKDGNTLDDDDNPSPAYRRPIELEAELIAKEILNTVGKPLFNLNRNLQYKDIVILLRTASNKADFIKRALENFGIPVFNDTDKQYYDSPEIADTLNILQVLDNPMQDIPLLGALSSPAFDFTPQELADIRIKTDYTKPFYECFYSLKDEPKIGESIKKIERWRLLAENLPFDIFIRQLIQESNIYTYSGALLGAEQRQANLRLLCEKAGRENKVYDLQSFLRDIAEARKAMKDGAVALSDGDNAVRIMTVHKSKGLEFPVVFLANACHRFRFDESSRLKMHIDAGFTLPFIDIERSTITKTYLDKAIKVKNERDIRSEEARLLYVAMTRAKNKLYLYLTPGSMDSSMQNWSLPRGDFSVASAKSMADFIVPAIYPSVFNIVYGDSNLDSYKYTGETGAMWEVFLHEGDSVSNYKTAEEIKNLPPLTENNYKNPFKTFDPSDMPLKSSVSALLKRKLWKINDNDEETPTLKRKPFLEENTQSFDAYSDENKTEQSVSSSDNFSYEKNPKNIPKNYEGLKYIKYNFDFYKNAELSPQEKGIAVHKFLSAVNLDILRGSEEFLKEADIQESSAISQQKYTFKDALEKERQRLFDIGILNKKEKEAVNTQKIAEFFKTPLSKRMLNSKNVQRELPFSLKLKSGTLLQGVIDCCFLEDEQIVVIDYKTDRNIYPMLPTYKEQMRWYVKALNTLSPYTVKTAALYSISEDKFFDVDISIEPQE
ncbi:MAG: UvrD-helicase domain-containing protein [Eubacteriales bacterium]|nr:UvrD-helicase domain-containing protein [Eubacteriales bacterium]